MKNKLFELLPYFFKKNDSYRDKDGKGILERFLLVIGEYLEYLFNLVASILGGGNSTGIVNPLTTDDYYLEHISEYVGRPPMLFNTDEAKGLYRELLRNIVTLYHWKGTNRFFEVLFKYYGLGIIIEEVDPTSEGKYNRYDHSDINPELNYDQEDIRYDGYEPCLPCSVANVQVIGLDDMGLLDDEYTLNRIIKILDLYRPINTIFNVTIVNRVYVLGTESGDILTTEDGDPLLIKG